LIRNPLLPIHQHSGIFAPELNNYHDQNTRSESRSRNGRG